MPVPEVTSPTDLAAVLRSDHANWANIVGETALDKLGDEVSVDPELRSRIEGLLLPLVDEMLADGAAVWRSLQGFITAQTLRNVRAKVRLQEVLQRDLLIQPESYVAAERVYLALGGLVPVMQPLLRAEVKAANPLEALSLVSDSAPPQTIEPYFVSLATFIRRERDAILVAKEFLRLCRRLKLPSNGGLQAFYNALEPRLGGPMAKRLGYDPDAFSTEPTSARRVRQPLRLPGFLAQLAAEAEARRAASMSFAEAA